MNRRVRLGLIVVASALIGGVGFWAGHRVGYRNGTYRAGYRAGVWDSTPQHRALVVVKRNPGNGSVAGNTARWYDLRNPVDAARLRVDERMLTAQGVEHYIAEGRVESSLDFVTPPDRINGHR